MLIIYAVCYTNNLNNPNIGNVGSIVGVNSVIVKIVGNIIKTAVKVPIQLRHNIIYTMVMLM